MDFIIETQELARRFGNVQAVDGLDLCVPAGSVFGFLGPNGAGKTTTIRMLLGLIRPDRGQVQLFNRVLLQNRRELLAKVGALVESPGLYPHLTGMENLEVTRRLLNLPRQNISRALNIVRMEKDANRLVRGYSMGMRQRLGLALALLSLPALLVLDEPTNGLDPAGIHEMRDLITQLPKEHGITVFLSSHLLSEVEQVANHLGIIQKGRLLFQGSPADLRDRRQEYLTLEVDRPEAARELLARGGWRVEPHGSSHLRVDVNRVEEAAIINARLVSGGVNVFHLSLEQPSLEEIFLRLTQNAIPLAESAAAVQQPATLSTSGRAL